MSTGIIGYLQLARRMVTPFAQPWRTVNALREFPGYVSALIRYSRATSEPVPALDLYPCLGGGRNAGGVARGHYFYQDIWAAKKVFQSGVREHVDIGSRVDGFVAHCAVFTKVTYIDIRPLQTLEPNIVGRSGSVLGLPFADHSIASVSCLHVAEHIGLGRYGDPLDPNGSKAAMKELQRVLAPGGNLLFAVPIGRERVCFNAHRVLSPATVLQQFDQLTLADFSAVNDAGDFMPSCRPEDLQEADYSCGLFHFSRPGSTPS